MSSSAGIRSFSAEQEEPIRQNLRQRYTGLGRALGFAVMAAAGSLAMFPMWGDAFRLWSQDPLRSIGAIFPLISLILVLWRWQGVGFSTERGTLWGLPLIVAAIFGARVFNQSRLYILIGSHHVGLLHPGILLCAYGVGCTLVFGGLPLLRRTIFPLCLLLFLNPVPRAFNTLVDLPLQLLSANTARGFAHLIGLQPTGEQLKMMFAPDFGMMIVPGCNGVRGSVTLGYLALIFGYTRRLSVRALALLTLGAFLMGYVLNLTRLCFLVIYYRIGISVPAIQPYGAQVDYAIGCTIFLIATLCIGIAVRMYQQKGGRTDTEASVLPMPVRRGFTATTLRAICFAALTVAFIIPQARAIAAAGQPGPTAEQVLAAMPSRVGDYRLTRTWTEHDTNNHVSLVLGDYAADGNARRLTLGLWMGGDNHFVANSKLYQGIRPEWNGSFDAVASGSLPVHFVGNFYNDGVTRSFDAETACSDVGCLENLMVDPKTGLVFNSPSFAELAVARTTRRLPILVRREWADNTATDATLRNEFEADARAFVSHLDLATLLQRAGTY